MPHSSQDVHKKVLGKTGEDAVEKYLKKQKVKILHRNYRTPFGEADIVAKEGEELVFVEVKTRSSDSYGSGAAAVDNAKQRRYRNIANYYLLKLGEEVNVRFDVAEVSAQGEIAYYKNAF